MSSQTRTIGGIETFRTALICRAFALVLLALALSPFNAPFATFDLTAVVEVNQIGGETAKIFVDTMIENRLTLETAMAFVPLSDQPGGGRLVPQSSSAFDTILRI